MVYFCLTILEGLTQQTTQKRQQAVMQYNIDREVLNKIGQLSSEKGGLEGRKHEAVNDDFTPKERRFPQQAVKVMIRRVAEKAHNPNTPLAQLSLSDLPPI